MKKSFHKVLITLLATATLAACDKNNSNGGNSGPDLRPLNVTPANLAGAWQVNETTNEGEILQFEITDTRVTLTTAKNNAVTSRFRAKYTLQNNRLVTQDGRRSSMQDFDILVVTATTMQMRPATQEGPGNNPIVWSLTRIDPSLLVGGPTSTTPLEQYIQMDMFTPTLQFSKTYKKVSNSDQTQDDYVDLTCRYRQERGIFDLDLTTYRRRMDPRSQQRAIEAQVSLRGRVDLDLSSEYSTASFNIVQMSQQQRPGFVATFNPPRSRAIYFSLGRRGSCNVSLNREGAEINFTGECRNIDAAGDRIEGNSRINLRGSCLLE